MRSRQSAALKSIHCEKGLDQRTFVVRGAAAENLAVPLNAREGRHDPRFWIDRLHIAMDDQAENGSSRRAGQFNFRYHSSVVDSKPYPLRDISEPGLLVDRRLLIAGDSGKAYRLRQ
jgi:hypothetical protein